MPDVFKLSKTQRRALVIAVVIVLFVGVILVRSFFSVIVLSALLAVIFYPIYTRLTKRTGRPGTAAMLTFLFMLLAIIIPLTITVIITIGQVEHIINNLQHGLNTAALANPTTDLLGFVNKILSSITHGSVQITSEQLASYLAKVAAGFASFLLGLLTSSFTGIANVVTEFILFMYLFTAMLTHADDILRVIRALNPLGNDISEMYLTRTAEMARGVVGGQFVIAFCQGVVEAAILYACGIHYFFFFALILTILSIIPLGGGIVAIPIGIIMILIGNVWQGLVILLGHFIVIVNIDNFLRPRLIPKSVRMNSALMMLAVFGGIGLFGFLGIAIGPIIMILVTSTLELYVPLAEANQITPAAKRTAK